MSVLQQRFPGLVDAGTLSPSMVPVKVALTSAALLFALIDLAWIEAARRPLRILAPMLTYLGSISYALYALHAPLILLANSLLEGLPPIVRFVAFATAVLALSHLMERIVQPVLAHRLQGRTRRPAAE